MTIVVVTSSVIPVSSHCWLPPFPSTHVHKYRDSALVRFTYPTTDLTITVSTNTLVCFPMFIPLPVHARGILQPSLDTEGLSRSRGSGPVVFVRGGVGGLHDSATVGSLNLTSYNNNNNPGSQSFVLTLPLLFLNLVPSPHPEHV